MDFVRKFRSVFSGKNLERSMGRSLTSGVKMVRVFFSKIQFEIKKSIDFQFLQRSSLFNEQCFSSILLLHSQLRVPATIVICAFGGEKLFNTPKLEASVE
jgi:hypothetical protein